MGPQDRERRVCERLVYGGNSTEQRVQYFLNSKPGTSDQNLNTVMIFCYVLVDCGLLKLTMRMKVLTDVGFFL